uniref:Uncharacterized protein n=1 Tax=Odontella aurita TaxID=265563 RepID=A0A7S4IK88_9STRA|mmetsp:Transcript_26358/g.77941  ORF Transcript_26358/g.77941 Transcript_26358/m.77941 type:complete len:351 (+) Transcript_26358:1832-2884(+)
MFGKGVELIHNLQRRYRPDSESTLIQSLIAWSTMIQTIRESIEDYSERLRLVTQKLPFQFDESLLNLRLLWGLDLLRFGPIYKTFITGSRKIGDLPTKEFLESLTTFETNNMGTTHDRFKPLQAKRLLVTQATDPKGPSSFSPYESTNLTDSQVRAFLKSFGGSKCALHRSDKEHHHPWWKCPVLEQLGFKIEPPQKGWRERRQDDHGGRGGGRGGDGGRGGRGCGRGGGGDGGIGADCNTDDGGAHGGGGGHAGPAQRAQGGAEEEKKGGPPNSGEPKKNPLLPRTTPGLDRAGGTVIQVQYSWAHQVSDRSANRFAPLVGSSLDSSSDEDDFTYCWLEKDGHCGAARM